MSNTTATYNSISLGDHVMELDNGRLDISLNARFGVQIEHNQQVIPAHIRQTGTAVMEISLTVCVNTTDSPTLVSAIDKLEWLHDKAIALADSMTAYDQTGKTLTISDGTDTLNITNTYFVSINTVRSDKHLKQFACSFVKPLGT